MAIQKNKRSSTAAPAGKLIKKVKRDEPTELHADPMIDPTDSSGSEMDDEEDEEESDAGDDDLEEFEGDDAGEVEDEGIPASSPHKNGTTEPSAEAGPSRRPAQSHVKGKSLYAPATAEELERLRSAQETGNTFTLQLEDLVARTLLPITPHPGTKDLLSRLHDLILGMPPLEAVSPKEALKRTPDLPFVGGKEWSPLKGAVQWTLGWEKPAEVFVGGSWTAAGGYKKGKGVAGDVDLVVVMPSSMFSAKDRMDHRYFHKRVHYLAVIKGAIVKAFKKDAGLRDVEAEWAYSMGDARRPIVLLKAGKAQGLKYATEIKIHASLPSDVFSASHLSPIKSLCRINAGETQPSAEPASSHPTPLYASSIAHDTLHKAHLLNIHRLSTSLADRNVASFVALWRIWAAQRSLPPSRGGSAWFAGMLLGWIVDGGRIGGQGGVRERTKEVKGLGKGLGYWGSLRAVWEFLARTDFTATPIFVGGQEGAIPPMHFCAAFDNVLVDPTGTVNVLAGWEEGEVQLLKHHARETLAMLEDHSVDRFDELFAKPTKAQIGVYDEMIITDISSAQLIETPLDIAEQPSRSTRIATSIAQTLRQGLSDRARIVHVSVLDPARVQIGIIFDPTQANRVLDVGPSSDKAAEGEMFRKLWGEKADLRRFKDGTIAESVVWPISRPEDAALIPLNIVTWLLQRHFSISAADISARFSGEEWLSVVQIPASAREATCVAGAEKLGFSPIMKAYDELYRLLKSIDDQLPLAILNVVPADEALRYSSTFIPHPMDEARSALAPDCLRYVSSAEVILQFESSPRWPDDLSAIQKVKLAIFEKLARVITDSLKGSRAEIVFDTLAAAASDIEDQAGLEVLMANGVAFRLRIHLEKERTHLERIIEGDAPVSGLAIPLPPRKQAIPALAHYTTRFLHRPAHHSAITPLHSRFPSYSSATRLLKRWIASHMLSLHIPSEAVELIMASVYLESGSTSPPTSAGAGFARAVQRLATWSFDTEPLFVPLVSATHDASFAKGATEEEILQSQSGRTRFPSALRKEGDELFAQRHQAVQHGKVGKAHAVAEGKGAWTIITEQDTTGRRWTSTMPSRVIAGRVRQLAGASLELFTSGEALLSVKSLFKTPLSNYSLLIHLRSSLLPRYAQALEPTAAEWESRTRTQLRNLSTSSGIYGTDVRIGFDPAGTFARDLQRLYGDSLLIFHDDLGGSVIGMLFNPSFDQPRAFKPILGYNSMPVKTGSELVEVNRDAVVGEIARLGEGLIERIERVGV